MTDKRAIIAQALLGRADVRQRLVEAGVSFTNFREDSDFSAGHPEPSVYSVD